MRELLPTDFQALLERYKVALEEIKCIGENPERKCPELIRANKIHVLMWQVADDALNGSHLPIGG